VKIASPTFYSMGNSRTPVTVSVLSVLVNLALNLWLVQVLGYRGLALGTAIAAGFNALTLLWLLRRRLGGLDGRSVATATLKITIASALMGAAAYFCFLWLEGAVPGTGEVARALRVFIPIAVALLVLAASARLLRIEEFDAATARVAGRFRRR
jgi:putative peptidoglycan lipid II flippase